MSDFKTFLSETSPDGIGPREAIVKAAKITLSRIRHGYDTTAIVIPPRVGKSNLQRAIAIEAMETGLVGAVVCMVPWLLLSDQMNKQSNIEKMQFHHRMNDATILPRAIVCDALSGSIDPRFHQFNPKRHWWTMTMAQAQQEATRHILQSVATYLKQEERRPLLVAIDECHQTSSGPDGWGKMANELRLAGAHVLLLTGTPERSDNIAPFGFRTKERSRADYEGTRVVKGADGLCVETISAEKVSWDIDPDYEMTLREAWNQDIITKIDTRRFAFHSDGKDIVLEAASKAKRALSQALRDPDIITGAVKEMLDEMRLRRNQPHGQDTAAIIFVGSDRENDDEKDFECRQVKRIIENSWSQYFSGKADIKIATMGDDGGVKARSTIKRFVGDDETLGLGDVIVVKQMGGVGLDAPRIKVALDLSTTRTKASTMQRWMRVATKWGEVKKGTLILPDDPITDELYDKIIKEQGGQYTLENVTVLDSKPIEQGAETEKTNAPVISDFRRNGSVDQEGQRIDATNDLNVDVVFSQKPWLALILSRSQAADLINSGHLVAMPDARPPTKTAVLNIEQEVEHARATINNLAKKLTSKTAKYSSHNSEDWTAALRRNIMAAKSHAGILSGLPQCRDIDRLNKAVEYLEQRIRSHETAI